jgi:5'-methylthioinosine phosphorylase
VKSRLGLVVGSGFARLGFRVIAEETVPTPFGEPSSPILRARFGGIEAVVIARHGKEHSLAPHEINYRANVWALREQGVDRCIGVNLVGTIDAGFLPGELAVPDQLIDYTWGRESSFGGGGRPIEHVDFTEPFDAVLRGRLADAIAAAGHRVNRGIYGVMQGPRLETAAEIDRLARDGCAMVGMTAMPEAALARELEMAYAICAVGVNRAAGRGPSIHGEIERYVETGMRRAASVLESAAGALDSPTM